MDSASNELYVFAEELHDSALDSSWKVIFMNADKNQHEEVKTQLAELHYHDRDAAVLDAYTEDELYQKIRKNPDVVSIIMNISDETYDSRLKLINRLKNEAPDGSFHIILISEINDKESYKRLIYDDHIFDMLDKNAIHPVGLLKSVVASIRVMLNKREMEEAKYKIQNMMIAAARFVPTMLLKQLKKESITDIQISDSVETVVTILFLDIRSYTSLSEFLTPLEGLDFLNEFMGYIEPSIIVNNGFIDKHIGDSVMAIFPYKPDDGVKAAIEILKSLDRYNQKRIMKRQMPIRIGVGLNTGLVVLGTVGFNERMDCTVIGDAVNVASRVEQTNKVFNTSLIVSEKTYNMLENPDLFYIRSLGHIQIRGKKQAMEVYEVFNSDVDDLIQHKVKNKNNVREAIKLYEDGEYHKAIVLFQEVYNQNKFDTVVKYYINMCERKLRSTLAKNQKE